MRLEKLQILMAWVGLATSDGLVIVFSRRQWTVTRLVGVLTRAAIAL